MKLASPFSRIALAASGLLMLPAAAMAEGMPQLDFQNPLTTSQVVWGAIIFIVLYILAARFALPKVGVVLEERARHIARDLAGAEAAKANADTGVEEAMAATAKARADAQAAIGAAVDEAKKAATARAEAANAQLEKKLQDAETQIAAARTAAMGAIRDVASDTAETLIARLTGGRPDQQRLQSAIGAALLARGVG
ncbi:MAG TPA: F0F1 ATP synthase subunit B' [Acetobacteraceae bacterium]|nr:F0F1 ATP synthase subunit B' [Acetobacteraceae bacterium]